MRSCLDELFQLLSLVAWDQVGANLLMPNKKLAYHGFLERDVVFVGVDKLNLALDYIKLGLLEGYSPQILCFYV